MSEETGRLLERFAAEAGGAVPLTALQARTFFRGGIRQLIALAGDADQ